jgi:hypothetical protein
MMDDSRRFVAQHYRDFLSREPDNSGLQLWTNEIEKCGADEACRERERIKTSTAFFRSDEFGKVGFLVYRFYKAAFGNLAGKPVPVTFEQFFSDTQRIRQGVVVNQGDWKQQLEANKQAYALEFVQRPAFVNLHPAGTSAASFVDALFANAGVTPAEQERLPAISALGSGDTASRARALRSVAESQSLRDAESNRASVLLAYFGYLRRNPDDAPDEDFTGYDSRLAQLDGGGENKEAEMVKAFLDSDEYRQRLGS